MQLLRRLLVDDALAALRLRCAGASYLAILVFGSIPGARADIGKLASGGVLHSVAYAGLCLLVFCGVLRTRSQRALTAVATVAVMGAIDECVQSFFPYRGAAVADWLVDCAAAIVMASILYLLWPRLTRAHGHVHAKD